jgi:hypothetical protein
MFSFGEQRPDVGVFGQINDNCILDLASSLLFRQKDMCMSMNITSTIRIRQQYSNAYAHTEVDIKRIENHKRNRN